LREHSLAETSSFAAEGFLTAHEQLMARLLRYRERHKEIESPLTDQDFERGIVCIQSTLSPSHDYLVHADLHPRSLLSGGGRIVAIDPMPAIGHWSYDAACLAVKHESLRIGECVALFSSRWPEETEYIESISRAIALDEAAVCWLYGVRQGTGEYESLLSWARGA